jgi:hypothetical protein
MPWAFLGLALALTPSAQAWQDQPPGQSKGGADKKSQGEATKDQAAPAAPVDSSQIYKPEPELWAEPRRFDLLENTFDEIRGQVLTGNDERAIAQMATGQAPVDAELIKKYVTHCASELTRHSNIEALLQPQANLRPGQRNPAKNMEDAANDLVGPLLEPPSAGNRGFREAYVKELNDQAPKLLQGHLHTRTFYMIVLSRAASPQVIPTLIAQIRDKNQPFMVKLLASVGLTNIARAFPQLDPNSQSIPAARALAEFLAENPEIFWPIKWRALEALGSLRQATANASAGKAELAAVPFAILANPDEKVDVRAWAAWTLGWMQVPPQVRDYNFELVAYASGRAAVSIGEKIAALPVPDENPTQNLRMVPRLADPLVRILAAFVGDAGVRGSGLNNSNHPDASRARDMTRGIEQRIRAVASKAIEFSQSVGIQVRPKHAELVSAVEELRSFLAKNPPKVDELYPGGPKYDVPAPGAKPRAPGGTRPAGETKKDAAGAAGGR